MWDRALERIRNLSAAQQAGSVLCLGALGAGLFVSAAAPILAVAGALAALVLIVRT